MSALPGTTGRRRIYLMRHGHVDYFAKEVVASRSTRDVPLTPLGRDQAEAAGHALASVPFDRAVCSGLLRARETAEIVLAHRPHPAPPLESDSAFEEIRGGTPGQIRSRAELAARMAFQFDRALEPGATMFEGGEAFGDVMVRVEGAVRRVLAEPGWKQLLVVAHEGTNRMILSWAAGAGLGAIRAFEQDTACINILDFDMVPAEDGSLTPEIARVLIKAVNLTPYNYLKNGMNLTSLEAIFARLAS